MQQQESYYSPELQQTDNIPHDEYYDEDQVIDNGFMRQDRHGIHHYGNNRCDNSSDDEEDDDIL